MAEIKKALELSDQQVLPLKSSLSKDDEESYELSPNVACNDSAAINDGQFDSLQLSAHVMDADEVVAAKLDNSVVVDEEVEKARESKCLEIHELVERTDVISDNIVLKKLLRGPRYFDPADSSWGTCYNCGEEGHTIANCTSAKRRKPCFVCGNFDHNAKQCTKGKVCFICKKEGHQAKDCADKKFSGEAHSAKICLKCGKSGHDMFSCKNDYCSDDLKEIQCYICKTFGHLSCATYSSSSVGVISCYKCGQTGHTGLACTSFLRVTNGTESPSSCYKCGEGGHFARECSSSAKVFTRSCREPNVTGSPSSCYRCGEGGHFARECTFSAKTHTRLRGEPDNRSPSSCYKCGREGHFARECTSSPKLSTLTWEPNYMESPSSCYKCGEEGHFARECTILPKAMKRKRESLTPRQKHFKRHRNYSEGGSSPRDSYKSHKRDKDKTQCGWYSEPSKSKRRGGWITEDPGDFPSKKARTSSWKSPQTPKNKKNKFSNGRSYGSDYHGSLKFQKRQW